ncbi:MAG TPA: transcriptional regulator [Rikenellaceae bacterium]|nr:transcriptional regulator [Rikenellaceae bacterium]
MRDRTRSREKPSTTRSGWRRKAPGEVSPTSLRSGDNFCYICTVMGKLLYTMGEVAQELGENPSAVRYWSNYFEQFVKPQRNAKGNRLYHPEDIETLRQIQYLLKNQGLTLEGARQRLKEDHRTVERRVQVLDMLRQIREDLIQVRKSL